MILFDTPTAINRNIALLCKEHEEQVYIPYLKTIVVILIPHRAVRAEILVPG